MTRAGGPKPWHDFPFFAPDADRVEGVAASELTCFDVCLRDALYVSGHRDALMAMARPLGFAIRRGRRGEIRWVKGVAPGRPTTWRGLAADWVECQEGLEARDLVQTMLEAGRVVPVQPQLAIMPHSRWYGCPWIEQPHAIVVLSIDGDDAVIADAYARSDAGFAKNVGRIRTADLIGGLDGGSVCVWSRNERADPWELEARELLRLTEEGLSQKGPSVGAEGIAALAGVILSLRDHPARRPYLRYRLVLPLGFVGGRRTLLAHVVESSRDILPSPDPLVDALQVAADAWRRLTRVCFLYSESGRNDVPRSVPSAVDATVGAEAHVLAMVKDLRQRVEAWQGRG